MRLTITRHQNSKSYHETFHIAATSAVTLLAALYEIKTKLDPTLTFGAGCRSGICGSCAVLVNGKEQLSCSYKYQEGDSIEPLRYHPVVRDLKVAKTNAFATLKPILQSGSDPRSYAGSSIEKQTDCILCDSCYSSCPVLAVNPDFLGPFALTKAWRYVADPAPRDQAQTDKSSAKVEIIDTVQTNGIWDCTLCGECTTACPQGIDPKTDILMLRGESAKAGYSDPSFGAMDFGTPDFGGGFDPNAVFS